VVFGFRHGVMWEVGNQRPVVKHCLHLQGRNSILKVEQDIHLQRIYPSARQHGVTTQKSRAKVVIVIKKAKTDYFYKAGTIFSESNSW
jgi:hypothetical protein